jgi:hypothetical protein
MGKTLRQPQPLTFARLRKAQEKLDRILDRWRQHTDVAGRAYDSGSVERYRAAMDRFLRAASHKGKLNYIRGTLEGCADVLFSRQYHGSYSDLGYYVRLPAFPYRPRLTGYTSETVG